MADRVAIITGAGSGIGRQIAITLSRAGFTPVLVGRTEAKLQETRTLCGDATIHAAEVADPGAATRIVNATVQQLGRIDALVNNAGYAPMLPIEQLTLDQWRQLIDVNLSAGFYFVKACWPIFKRQGGGAVVNISSESARDPFPGLGAYGAAKAALNRLTYAIHQEGMKDNIRAYSIAPAAVETPMLRQIVSAEHLPTSQTLDPAEIARVALACIAGDLRHTSGETTYVHK